MRKLLLFLVVVILLLAACGPAPAETGPEPTKAAPSAAESTPQAAATAEPAAPEAPAKRVLRATFSWPTYIDPAVGSDYSSSSSLGNLYDTLIFANVDGGVDPWLAQSWDVSDDGLTYTFHLREGVKFHDGSELKASDVVYSYNRLHTIGEGYAYLVAGIESAEATGDYDVEFTLSQPSGLFVPSLVRLYILNEDLVRANTAAEGPYGAEGDYGKQWLLTHDAGSGPYQVVEYPQEEYLLMSKFADWWGEFNENAPDELRFIGTTETATVRTMMASGELEISDQWQTIEALEAMDKIDGVEIAAFPTMTAFYYMVNTRLAPTDDLHFRRAMAYAFDYDAAVALEWQGTKQMVGPVPATLGGHDPNVFTFHRDLDKAREELAQSKYYNDLQSYPVEVHWISDVPAEEKFALLFQANMAEIGINVKVVASPWLSVVEDTASLETSPHIVTIYVTADLPEAGLMLQQRYHSNSANTWQQNEWLLDDKFDADIEDALATADQAERFAKYAELQGYIAELAPSIFLYDQVQKHAYRADYVDWPAARNETSALMGYQFFAPQIGIKPH